MAMWIYVVKRDLGAKTQRQSPWKLEDDGPCLSELSPLFRMPSPTRVLVSDSPALQERSRPRGRRVSRDISFTTRFPFLRLPGGPSRPSQKCTRRGRTSKPGAPPGCVTPGHGGWHGAHTWPLPLRRQRRRWGQSAGPPVMVLSLEEAIGRQVSVSWATGPKMRSRGREQTEGIQKVGALIRSGGRDEEEGSTGIAATFPPDSDHGAHLLARLFK